jgi:hypothetical protein
VREVRGAQVPKGRLKPGAIHQMPSTISIAKALQLINGGSSKRVHETFPEDRLFGWQVKYGAFGICVSKSRRSTIGS